MADAPWRCSQCGTVNEPNATSCRSCGRWPSLFDLERSAVDVEPETGDEGFAPPAPAPEEFQVPIEPAPMEVAPDDPDVPEQPAEWPGPEDPLNRPLQGWPAKLASWIVPIAFLVYVAISIIANR